MALYKVKKKEYDAFSAEAYKLVEGENVTEEDRIKQAESTFNNYRAINTISVSNNNIILFVDETNEEGVKVLDKYFPSRKEVKLSEVKDSISVFPDLAKSGKYSTLEDVLNAGKHEIALARGKK